MHLPNTRANTPFTTSLNLEYPVPDITLVLNMEKDHQIEQVVISRGRFEVL